MPILPRYDFSERAIIIPLITFLMCYPVWYVFLLIIVGTGSRPRVIHMFENIPDIYVVAAFVIGITVFIALLASYSAFIANKKEEELAKKKAIQAGEPFDADQVAISSKYCWVYALFAILGAVVCAALVLVACDAYFIPHYVDGEANATSVALAGTAASVILYIIADKFLLRKSADGLFYSLVEEPLVEQVFQSASDAVEAKDEMKGPEDLGATIAAAIQNALKKQ